jgi:hypothetical protein
MQPVVDKPTTPLAGRYSIEPAGSALMFRTRHMLGLATVEEPLFVADVSAPAATRPASSDNEDSPAWKEGNHELSA